MYYIYISYINLQDLSHNSFKMGLTYCNGTMAEIEIGYMVEIEIVYFSTICLK